MTKLWFTFIIAICLISCAFAQSPTIVWSNTYGGYDSEYCTAVFQAPDGGYVLLGGTKSYRPVGLWMVKTDSTGYGLWSKTLGKGRCNDAIEVPEGYIIGGGYTPDDFFHYCAITIDSEGKRTNGFGCEFRNHQHSSCTAIALAKDGDLILTGSLRLEDSEKYPNAEMAWIAKDNPKVASKGGKPDKSITLNGADKSCVSVFPVESGGRGRVCHVFGTSKRWVDRSEERIRKEQGLGEMRNKPPEPRHDFWMSEFSELSQDLYQSRHKILGDPAVEEECHDVAKTADGGYLMVGTRKKLDSELPKGRVVNGRVQNPRFLDGYEILMIKVNTNGDSLWSRTFPFVGQGWKLNLFIKQLSDGNFIVGTNGNAIHEVDRDEWSTRSVLIKMDSSGEELWRFTLDPDIECKTLCEVRSGKYVIAGNKFVKKQKETDMWLAELQEQGDR